MGRSLNGKELGKGISQRKDGLYQGRYTDRFGKRNTFYDKSLNKVIKKLRQESYQDDKNMNIIDSKVTLDEWFETWIDVFKKNCRNSSKEEYRVCYNRIKKELGYMKIKDLTLIIVQNAFNNLKTDNSRESTKRVLSDVLNKAVDNGLLSNNFSKKINTVITNEERTEKIVMTNIEEKIFLEYSRKSCYYNIFVVALETGMRIGELLGLCWGDVDFNKKIINVKHNLCYFHKDGKYVFEMHGTKTKSGNRIIPLTTNAMNALKRQRLKKNELILKNISPIECYEDLVFVTKKNTPMQGFSVNNSLERICNKIMKEYAEFPSITSHTFRHTFATRAIERGMNPKTLQKILGHSTLHMTMDLYCHVTNDTLFREMDNFEKLG